MINYGVSSTTVFLGWKLFFVSLIETECMILYYFQYRMRCKFALVSNGDCSRALVTKNQY